MGTTTSAHIRLPDATESALTATGARLLYIDNVRIFLTVLVIAHHLMAVYANSGGWLYHEGRQDVMTAAIGGWFSAVNQAYFMGLFLFVAAYFVPGAYDRKGADRFVRDRLIRLGVPLALYSWLFRPLFIYFGMRMGDGPFWQWYTSAFFRDYGWIGGGPLWFIELLLFFSILYAAWKRFRPERAGEPMMDAGLPSSRAIYLFAVLIGVGSFLVRVASPINDTFVPLNLQFANFAQYVALFIAGLAACQRDWLSHLPRQAGKRWLGVAVALILLYGPLAILSGAPEDATPFLGGWHWQSLMFAVWEALLCVSMCIGLLTLFQARLDQQGALARECSRGAYAAYLIHEPVITLLAMSAGSLWLHPLLKFLLATGVAIPLCFGLGILLRRVPGLDCVL